MYDIIKIRQWFLEKALCDRLVGSQTQQVEMPGFSSMLHASAGLPNAFDLEPQVFLLSLDFSFVTLSFHQGKEK
jgi:hypothetical protein